MSIDDRDGEMSPRTRAQREHAKSILDAVLDNQEDMKEDFVENVEAQKNAQKKEKNEQFMKDQMCIECEDQPWAVTCVQCQDNYCDVCFQALHKKGNRKGHTKTVVRPELLRDQKPAQAPATKGGNNNGQPDMEGDSDEEGEFNPANNSANSLESVLDKDPNWFASRAQYIPLRLTYEERKWLRLLQAAMHVSEYTDKVDIITWGSKAKRMAAQLREICAILSGLVIAADYNQGQVMIKDKNFVDNEAFFQKVFEIGRRYKVMNPEKMRSEYGKLIYMLQDSMLPHVQELLNFKVVKPMTTVHLYLSDRDAEELLTDPLMAIATREILSEGKGRHEVNKESKMKEKAIAALCKKYQSHQITDEEIKQCLYSITDNHAYLRTSRDAVDKVIMYLKHYFTPEEEEDEFSLSIQSGRGGARLSHNHARQYHYVLQSLMLWREVSHEMFKLWYLAEEDLLGESNYYRLMDTGQGLNRVQDAPRVGKIMHRILRQVQEKVEQWVGSSVIHLGDHNVPNALMFIDKYNQVPRILNPIVSCLDKIPSLMDNPKIVPVVQQYGGVDKLRKTILADFFRHAFDGSGADNFFDAGSCIDGRLTSAWNWCSLVEKKSYFHIFLLTGFIGFDGQF
jgi:hypothetical protein